MLVKGMAYCSIKSINAGEKKVDRNNVNNYWKVALESILSINMDTFNEYLGLSGKFDVDMLSNYKETKAKAKRVEAYNNGNTKSYRARFIFLDGNDTQNQIVFGARENTIEGKYSIDLEKVRGTTTITSAEAKFNFNGTTRQTTNGKWTGAVKDKTITANNVNTTDTYTLTEVEAPTGYIKLKEPITVKVTKKAYGGKYVVKSVSVSPSYLATATVNATGTLITIKVKNTEITGKYSIDIVKKDASGKDTITSSETKFKISDGSNEKINNTSSGILEDVIKDKKITTENLSKTDTYTITEETAPIGYIRLKESITVKVTKKQDGEQYVVDTVAITPNDKVDYEISSDRTRITIKVKNTEITGEYDLDLIKVNEETETILKTPAKFTIQDVSGGNTVEMSTQNGTLTFADKKVTKANYSTPDVFIITETDSPRGYVKMKEPIKVTVYKELDQANETYKVSKVEIDDNGMGIAEVGQDKKSVIIKAINIEKKGKYILELVKKGEKGETITESNTIFGINGNNMTTSDGKIRIEKEMNISNLTDSMMELKDDVYTITEVDAPEDYVRFKGEIKLTIGKKELPDRYELDPDKVSVDITNPLLDNMVEVKSQIDNQGVVTLTLEIKDKEITGEYDFNIAKMDTLNNIIGEATFTVTESKQYKNQSSPTVATKTLKTTNGKISVKKKITKDDYRQPTVFTITETSAPEGYEKFNGTITLNIVKKLDEQNEKYILDTEKSTMTITNKKDGTIATTTFEKAIELVSLNVQNERYIDVSGYVWIDKSFDEGKESKRNDLYKEGSNDTKDERLENVTVRLKDQSGKIIKTTSTYSSGEYKFEKILESDLQNYYIEFEYNGMIYQNVENLYLDKENGSKAKENDSERKATNEQYAIQTATSPTSFNITADTNETKFILYDGKNISKNKDIIERGELKNVNLGLYEREQPDLAILKDVWNAQVSVNNKRYIYNYADRFDMLDASEGQADFKVKFEDKYTGTYCQPIYPSDMDDGLQDQLRVYVTYRIQLKNESTSLQARVNNIVDYFDSNYQIIAVGTGINDQYQITGNLNAKTDGGTYTFDGKSYHKVTITPSQEIIGAQKKSTDSVYIQFELDKVTINTIMNASENERGLDNRVEINSQTTYDANGNPYAGIDKDSTPGNYEQKQDEDDNDKAPLYKLVDAGNRTTTGTVFIDDEGTSADINPGQERLGNGEYNESVEKGLPGVSVTLNETSGSGKTYTGETDSNGNFSIAGFIPGDYTMTYTWGGQTYNNGSKNIKITVQDYKGTIYKNKDRQNNTKWYREVNPIYSDALDNYEKRKEIDGNNTEINFKTDFESGDSKMDSTTPMMVFDIENTDTNSNKVYLNNEVNTPNYVVERIDFGIVERPRQQIIADKKATKVQMSLPNGQQIIDATIDRNGNISGERTGLTAEPGVNGQNGFMKIEIDNELLQGSTLKIKYKIIATNNSEIDYNTSEYYLYGEKPADNSKLAALTPLGIMDYLDENWKFDEQNNNDGEWVELKDTELTDLIENPDETSVKAKTKLYSQKLSSNALLPKNTSNNDENSSIDLDLVVSKYLSIQDEIVLANDVEIVKVGTNIGRKLYHETPGNYVPAKENTYEGDDDRATPITITPHTGGNGMEGIQKAAIGMGILIALGIGIVFIKKKVLG